MCAIFGIINSENIKSPENIKEMSNLMQHRGPDARGFAGYSFHESKINKIDSSFSPDYNCLLGHNRLSIQDLSEAGAQPMLSVNNKVCIIFNGEIYNTEYLKSKISSYTFKGHSDTEVVLAYYLEYGIEKTAQDLNGMFSIVILDVDKSCLYFIRDRLGIKPFYYADQSNSNKIDIIFSSEIKAFLCCNDFTPQLNQHALYEYFTFGDPLQNLISGVKEVFPGEIITIDFKAIKIKHKKYWDLNEQFHPVSIKISENDLLDLISQKLSDSVKRQLISDVKTGCQLSGGIDSSLVTYFASKYGLKDSVSIIPNDKDFSEESFIDYIAAKNEINAHKFLLESDFIEKNLEKAVWHYESIITYHNVVALLMLSKEAKKYVTVLLSGEGSDELFGGYTWFEDGYYASKYFDLKKGLYSSESYNFLENKIRGLKNAKSYSEFAVNCTDTISSQISENIFEDTNSCIGGGYNHNQILNERISFFDSFNGTDFDKHIKYELSTRLRNLLIRQDKTSMANSIENRVPILDNEIIDLAFSLPQNVLLQFYPHSSDKLDSRIYSTLKGKFPLKKIASEIYGNDFSFRRKVGFPLPFHKYMYTPVMKSYFYDSILPGIKKRNFLNSSYIKTLYENTDINSNRWNFAPLWKAITFEIWCKQFLDKKIFGV